MWKDEQFDVAYLVQDILNSVRWSKFNLYLQIEELQ